MKYSKLKLVGTFVLVMMLAVAAAGCGGPEEVAETKTAELGYVPWDSETASTHVIAAVLEEEMGYEVEVTDLEPGPMFTGLAQGSFDVSVSAWLPGTHATYMEDYGDDFENLGANLEGAKIGWVVPTYVEIDSIAEMNDNADRFENRVVGIDPGAGLMEASDAAMDVYELEENFELVDGSDATMTAALQRAIENDEWVVVTGWTPHWKFGRWDLKYLDDPEGVFGEAEHIATIVRHGLAEDDPVLYEFADNFFWESDDMGEVMVMIEDGMDPAEAASQWVGDNPDKVAEWIPEQ